MKFSLRTLLVAALLISVACALLASRSEYGSTITQAAYQFSLLAALVATIYRSGAQRAFWIGYSIFGWGRLWLEMDPVRRYGVSIHEFLYGEVPTEGVAAIHHQELMYRFLRTLANLESIVIALLGGCLAAFLYRRREKANR
ncbi:hypothetical protein NG895_13490 [Aeoliella sp. ICT_H6.2]|uniref:Uncharacterized protein n=1 Tax=Aeoliella straminimaris TaxID=2954799 RepID=A0A9X2FB50_9BACT|nr:hypothetical protein [Aeoliella straminimaris]MCO6044917.1 hypothetical protein [Aeoliella straminimaris]